MTTDQAFNFALQHHQSGRLAEAEALYRQILAVEPSHACALHLLGVIAHQAGRSDVAINLIRQAIAQTPAVPDFHSNLGEACRALGRFDEAVASYRRAIALQPDYPEAHSNLGIALYHIGQMDEAVASFHRAIAIRPDYAEAHCNLGVVLKLRGHPEKAITAYRRAIVLKRDYAEAHCNLGITLHEQGRAAEAIFCYREAIALRPGHSDAYAGLGNALRATGSVGESIAAFRQAIALAPRAAKMHNDLGVALQENGQLEDAIAVFRKAITLDPGLPEVHSNLGNALRDADDCDGAIASIRRAVALNPRLAEAHISLGAALHATGQLDGAVESFRMAVALEPGNAAAHSNLVVVLSYHAGYGAADIAGECRRWNRQHAEPLRHCISPHGNDPLAERRLRIGYVSADFREHIVGHFLLRMLGCSDRAQFEICCYSAARRPDEFTVRFRSLSDRWLDIAGMKDEQVAERIREDGVDILVDLSLHTAGNRLLVFARQPAPVQVSFAAYPGSTGLEAIGYRISDRQLEGGSSMAAYGGRERAFVIPSFWCYDGLGGELPVNALPAVESGVITFGCLNNFCKINASVLRLWAKILLAVPASRLLLLAPRGSHRQRTKELLSAEGVTPERIAFVSHQPRSKYMERYHQIDVSLDTFPYNGHTTSLDSLWMGVPVVTLVGQTIVGRAGLSQLMNLNIPELIGTAPEQYVQIATELSSDLPRLAHLRASLRERMTKSQLMDAPQFTRDIEAAYREMWRAWCEETTPKTVNAKSPG